MVLVVLVVLVCVRARVRAVNSCARCLQPSAQSTSTVAGVLRCRQRRTSGQVCRRGYGQSGRMGGLHRGWSHHVAVADNVDRGAVPATPVSIGNQRGVDRDGCVDVHVRCVCLHSVPSTLHAAPHLIADTRTLVQAHTLLAHCACTHTCTHARTLVLVYTRARAMNMFAQSLRVQRDVMLWCPGSMRAVFHDRRE